MKEMVLLKNGKSEFGPLVARVMSSLLQLMNDKPAAFYELVMCARDTQHKPCGEIGKDLMELSMLQPDGSMHDSIRNIVQSAAEGEDLDMQIVDPRSPNQPAPVGDAL